MLTHPAFDPVAISLGPLQVHWYGLMYLAGFAFVFLLGKRLAKQGKVPFSADQVDDLVFYAAMGVVIGGRLGYVLFYDFARFLDNPLWAIQVWTGGMAFHGGLIGVIVGLSLFAHKHDYPKGAILDFAALAAPVGLFFGRIGNFIGQELWGRASDLPWAMIFPRDPLLLARHPSQLYEAFAEGLVLFFVIYVFSRQPRPFWSAGGIFLLGYGSARFCIEFVREPDSHIGFDLFDWISRGQILSTPMIIAGVALLLWSYKTQPNLPQWQAQQAALQTRQTSSKKKHGKANRKQGKKT